MLAEGPALLAAMAESGPTASAKRGLSPLADSPAVLAEGPALLAAMTEGPALLAAATAVLADLAVVSGVLSLAALSASAICFFLISTSRDSQALLFILFCLVKGSDRVTPSPRYCLTSSSATWSTKKPQTMPADRLPRLAVN